MASYSRETAESLESSLLHYSSPSSAEPSSSLASSISKWVWNRMKRGQNTLQEDNPGLVDDAFVESSAAVEWKYDVFLSFRGRDTRKGITFELYDQLQRRGIKAFMDDRDLEVGDVISPTLLRAIRESRFAIVVLSQNYASSTWCLEELAKICECMEDQNRILPLFYHVEPSDVRYQKRSFEEAFSKHETSGRHPLEKVQQWRDALNKVATFSGWNTQDYKNERGVVEAIVELLSSKVVPDGIESTGDFEAYGATRKAMDEVMKALKDDEVTAVGVYGMGGVGKTSMVRHVAAQACKNGTFDHWIMGVVSQNPDLRKIQDTLADQLGVKLHEITEIGRAATLSREIMRRSKFLIILDDIWRIMDLSDIGIPSYEGLQNCNSKILLTTRRLGVCHAMDCQVNITLSTLSEDDSWTLFVRTARRSFESTTFEGVAKKVAGECAGLPIKVIEVARALGDKELLEWEEAAQRLEKSQIVNIDDGGYSLKCIKLSYDYLKDEDSKSCFLLCCLFPEGYDIPVADLFRYAMGKGLFRDAGTIEEARGRAHSVVKHLKNSSLLLDSEKNGCVRMHDVFRDTAINIAKSEDGRGFLVRAGCGLKRWPGQLHEGYSAISLMNNDIHKLPGELVCPELQILVLQGNNHLEEIPEAFFQSSSALLVLDLCHTSITSLPQSFSLLTNLQALYFDSCPIIDFSALKTLKKLEILSLRGNVIKELSREIGNLTNLRTLDFTGGRIGKIPSKIISELHRLEELYMDCGFWEWGSKVEGGEETYIGFDELTGLSNLRIVQVCISDAKCIPEKVEFDPNWVYFGICIRRDRSTKNIARCLSNQVSEYGCNSRSLILDTSFSNLPDWFVNVVTKNTEKLHYKKFKDLNNILVEYHHGRLHSLKHLSVIGPNEGLKELMNGITWVPNTPVFVNLEELHLESVDCLKKLCVGELPPGSLVNLKLLKVDHCPNLENVLLPTKLLQSLPNLENLICKDIRRLEDVFGCQGFEPEQSKLREMTFFNLPAARNICNGPAPQAMFQNLKSLFIYRCNFLGGLFSFDAAQFLVQLEDLFVDNCPLLERLIEASKETVSDKKTVLPKLKNLVLEKLPMLYSGSGTIDIECPSLEHLNVKECPHFSASASDFQSRKQVQLNDKLYYFGLLGKSTERELVEAITESVYCKVEPM